MRHAKQRDCRYCSSGPVYSTEPAGAIGCCKRSPGRDIWAHAQGMRLLSLKPLPVKRWSRYRINQDRFIDLRYDYFTSSVAVTTTDVPHYPWTFSESMIDRGVLKMSGEPSLTGALAIDRAKSGAQLICREEHTR
jgi:hypothetical protein